MKFIKFVAVVLGFSLLFQGVTPSHAVVVAPSLAAEDFLSARLQAAVTGSRILVISELSEMSTTWVNPDGTLTTEAFGSAVRVRDGAGQYGWRDLDFTLVFDDAGLVRAKSGRYDFQVSGGGSKAEVASTGLVSISGSDGKHFGFGWDGALPKPVLSEDTARFVDVLPNVDLLVRLDASGFEQFFEVKAKPDAVTLDRLRLLVRGKNVRLEEDGAGGYEFVSGTQVLGSIPTPYMYDSAEGTSAPVTEELEPVVGSTGILDLGVDAGFFERDDLEYPVIVDPAVVLSPTFDTYVTNAFPTTDYQSSTELLVGTPDGGSSVYRSYLNFDSTAWIGQDIISASLKLYLKHSWSCTARSFSVYAVSPATPSTRWANAPTIAGTAASRSVAAGYSSSCPAASVETNVTNLAKNMPVVISNRAGFGIKAANESDSLGWKRFNSSNATSNKPSLTVNYNRFPGTAVTPSVSDATVIDGVVKVSALKPTLTSKASDPDSDNVTLTFKTYQSATSLTATSTLCSVTVASGSSGSCKPASALTSGQTYYVRATSSDGRVSAESLSPVRTFKVDVVQPLPPTITCPYVNGYQGGATPSSTVSCVVSTATTQGAKANKVRITVSGQPAQELTANADGSFSHTVSLPAGAFQHRITAVAVSDLSISSLTATHTMSFGLVGVLALADVPTVASTVVVSGYGSTGPGLTPSNGSIQWRKTGSLAAWETAVSNLPMTTRSNVKGVYDYKLNVATLSGSGDNLLSASEANSVDLRFCFYYAGYGETACSSGSGLTFVRTPAGADAALTSAGPGLVSLVSGRFTMSDTDFSQQVGLHSLAVSRTYTGNQTPATGQAGVFGPGWLASFSSDATSVAGFLLTSDAVSGLYYLVSPDQEVLTFSGTTNLVPVNDAAKAANLQVNREGNTITVVEADQATTTFVSTNNGWKLTCARANASSRAVINTFDDAGRVLSSGYASSSSSGCSGSVVTQGLSYIYNAERLALIRYNYLDAATGLLQVQTRVAYTYDSLGRLTQAKDTINNSFTSYEYDNANRLIKVTDSGFAPTTFKYDSSNRLVQVARSQNSFWGLVSNVENTFVYDLAPAGNTGFLPNLPASTVDIWGQEAVPFYAAAVFGADTVIALDGSGNVVVPAATDTLWRRADFTFLDVEGRETNTASYGKTKWLYTAVLRDEDGVVEASFDSEGIENVLDHYESEGHINFDALMFASVSHFYTVVNGVSVPYGVYVSDSWSPKRTISDGSDGSVEVRTHTSYLYDENAGLDVLKGLLTSSRVGLVTGSAVSVDSQQLSRVKNEYVAQDGSPVSGWSLGQPTLVTSFDSSNTPVAVSKTVYNQFGQTVKAVAPGSNGADARTDVYVYYTAEANSLFPECGLKPAWQDLLCISQTGETTPSSKSFVSAYDFQLNPVTVSEYRSGVLVRTTTNTYLADGRLDQSTVSAAGVSSIATMHVYDPVSLLETKTESYVGGVKQSEVSESFDAWGRQTSSTNSLGEITNTSYVPSGQLGAGSVSAVISPVTTSTYVYGDVSDPRAVVTQMNVSTDVGAATAVSYQYSGVYDEYGRLTSQNGPNGLTQSFEFNDAGQISSMSYEANGTTSLSWGREYDGFGRVVRETAPESSASTSTAEQTTVYTYDPSSRLATSSSNGSSCFSESYGYNSRGDRTSSSVGVCGVETTKTRSFNSESQLTSPGYVYDALGRNTLIPAADAPANNAAITLAYNLVDQVTGITQSGSTTSFTYDALGRRVNETAGGLTTVRHYGDSSDNPEWTTQVSGSNLTTDVYTGSLGSGLAVTTTFKGTVATASMQLTNLRGHVVTTLDLDSNSVSGWCVYDSFGNPQTSQTNDNLINYSSYGQQERATNTTGLILMGARVYNPETNQFTSKDPIKGGNENSYTYPNDPINGSDFSGLNVWIDLGVLVVGALVTSAICAATAFVGCLVGSIVVGAVGGFIKAGVKIKEEKIKKNKIWETLGWGALSGALDGALGAGIGKGISMGISKLTKVKEMDRSARFRWRSDISTGIVYGAKDYIYAGYKKVISQLHNKKK